MSNVTRTTISGVVGTAQVDDHRRHGWAGGRGCRDPGGATPGPSGRRRAEPSKSTAVRGSQSRIGDWASAPVGDPAPVTANQGFHLVAGSRAAVFPREIGRAHV